MLACEEERGGVFNVRECVTLRVRSRDAFVVTAAAAAAASVLSPDDKQDREEFRAAADQQCCTDCSWTGGCRRRKRFHVQGWSGGHSSQWRRL